MPNFQLGPAVRSRLGRFEIPAADRYRSLFINLEDCAEVISSVAPAARILEVGCGDGTMAQRLLDRYPEAEYVGIDVAPNPGRLFRGDRSQVSFRSIDSTEFLATESQRFDLVVVVDVMHHVPLDLRDKLMLDVQELTTPGGRYMIKEWDPIPGPSHWACWSADRFISGDRIKHMPMTQMKSWLAGLLGDELVLEARIPPHRHNYLLAYAR